MDFLKRTTKRIRLVTGRRIDEVPPATVLGMVGAGGLGFELVSSLKLFKYPETATCIIVITLMVIIADTASSRLRNAIQRGASH
jgi:phosphonate transport system permease protein